ncbi:MAG: hypothetical protein E6I96_13825 [Chloroflexi bacterium]|nr:MAG: hypothetical protein E6I96_13825 [Chloroflexota bacterium]
MAGLPVQFVEILACPDCGGSVAELPTGELRCTRCSHRFPVHDRIPHLLPTTPKAAESENTDAARPR